MDNELDPKDIKRLLDESAAQDEKPSNDATDPRAEDDAAKRLQDSLTDLAGYKKALEQEFAKVTSSDENLSTKALDSIIKLVPDAGEAISYLLNHADSEGVRAGLAKWVFDKVLRQYEKEGQEDELNKLIKSLTKTADDE